LTADAVPEGFDITPAFIQGTHPMFFSGPWHIGLIEDAGGPEFEGKWAMAQMPKKETGTSFVGGSDLVVFKNGDNKEAAWEFVKYLSQPEVQQKWYDTVSDLPSVQSAWESGTLATDDKLGLFGEQLKDAKTPPVIPHWEQVAADAVNTELEKATIGDSSAEEAAKGMQEKASSIGAG
jgi:multiple sugar transport system substrate-binding protein